MKIALIGEYSSLHKYLKDGLLELGEDVDLASDGDDWKKIGGGTLSLPKPGTDIRRKFQYLSQMNSFIREIHGYDVVQIINTNFFTPYLNSNYVKRLKKNNHMLSLAASGSDYAIYEAYKKGYFDYYIFDFFSYPRYNSQTFRGKQEIATAKFVEKISDVIIPSAYEYSIGYATEKKSEIIPFPINVDQILYNENCIHNKIVFFHGLNREAVKGTAFIRKALERLKEKYPNDVEVILDGHMPFDSYMKLMKRCNVIIDQCCGYGYGVNSCLAMAQGKVVLSCFRQETLDAMGAKECPGVLIKPDTEQIFEQLCHIVENKSQIPEIGYRSRIFVEENHHYINIAQKYLTVWKNVKEVQSTII